MKAVEVVNVSKKFGALAALSNVNMYVDTEEIVGLIGPNGAGKTTLFNILTGFLKPDTGVVKIFGDDVTNLPPHKIAQKKVARSFQIIKPFPSMTVLESVMVGGYLNTSDEKTARERAVEALKMVGVHHLSDRLAKELNTQQLKLVELARWSSNPTPPPATRRAGSRPYTGRGGQDVRPHKEAKQRKRHNCSPSRTRDAVCHENIGQSCCA
jgi:ABC-type branched-subunit amino acid transport system ATPase component